MTKIWSSSKEWIELVPPKKRKKQPPPPKKILIIELLMTMGFEPMLFRTSKLGYQVVPETGAITALIGYLLVVVYQSRESKECAYRPRHRLTILQTIFSQKVVISLHTTARLKFSLLRRWLAGEIMTRQKATHNEQTNSKKTKTYTNNTGNNLAKWSEKMTCIRRSK